MNMNVYMGMTMRIARRHHDYECEKDDEYEYARE